MAELGNKRQCPECETKFYDLGRSEKLCPKCGIDIETGLVPEAEDDKEAAGEE